jgi:hypothetical protein
MQDSEVNEGCSKLIAYMFIAGGFLAILVPAFVRWGLLPGGLDSPWLFCTFTVGVGVSFAAFLGLWVHAKRRSKPKLEVYSISVLALLTGSFWVYLLTLLI